ncbi:MAG: OmpP1/FadL family transporter [Nannocystales bacterium]
MVKQRTAKVSQRTRKPDATAAQPATRPSRTAARNAGKWSTGVWAAALVGCFAAAGVGDANASGIAAARFGGEHGHPTTDNPTAIYYNPAGIALSKGTHIFVDGTIALRWAGYERPAAGPDDVAAGGNPVQNNQETLGLAPGANDGKASLFNAIASPFLGVSSDFGTDFIYGGLSVSFPFGGSAVWDKNSVYNGNDEYPGAVDGQQRWYSIDGSIRSMYITGALAFNIRKIGLSIGLSGSAIRSNVTTLRARNADGTDDLVTVNSDGTVARDADGNTSLKEGRSLVDVNGWQGGFGIGLVYDVLKQGKYFIGASYTSQPNITGGMTLKGKLQNALATSQPDQSDVEFTQSLPDIFRLGFRIRPTDKYELRIFGDYTRWSVSDRQCLINVSSKNEHTCDFGDGENALDDPESYGAGTGEEDNPAAGVVQHLPRFWKDAGGVRIGGSYWFIPELEGYLGAGYDSSAVPLETLDPALMDMNKFSISAGVRWQIIKHLAMAFTATELIYLRTSTKGKSALNRFPAPTRQPSADGVYTQFLQLFNISADISF